VNRLLELTPDDLVKFSVWRVEGDSDETATVCPVATFNNPDLETYVARTRFLLADGSEWWGFCSPTDDSGLDYIQPVILTPSGPVRFWYDRPAPEPEPARTCRLLCKATDQIFPVRFECIVPFEGRHLTGELPEIGVRR
jgi:hypothetical protein